MRRPLLAILITACIILLIISFLKNLSGMSTITVAFALALSYYLYQSDDTREGSYQSNYEGGVDTEINPLEDLSTDELIQKAGLPKQYHGLKFENKHGYDEVSVGIVPISLDKTKVLLTQAKSGFWGFSKGHPDVNEDEKSAAVRENKEEIGLISKKSDLFGEFKLEDKMDIDEKMLRRHLIKMIQKEEEPHVNKIGESKRLMIFFAMYTNPENNPPSKTGEITVDKSEIMNSKWVSWDEAKELMKSSNSNQIVVLENVLKSIS